MKVIILCGGKGQRMGSDRVDIPKPLSIVKNKPIIYHIIKIYMKYGYNEFILPLGYQGKKIKEYFINHKWLNDNFIYESNGDKISFFNESDNFKITFVDTGIDTMTGSRIKKMEKYIDTDNFMVTYGDGLADIDISKLVEFHKKQGKLGTVTGIYRNSQYGILNEENGIVKSFEEKPELGDLINGGFFVFKKEFLNYIDNNNDCILEQSPLKNLVKDGELAIYKHVGNWKSIDTEKDLIEINSNWVFDYD